MKHFASPSFWEKFNKLPNNIQDQAKSCFKLLKLNPLHPSLHFKSINKYRSVRVGLQYRALGIESSTGIVWFFIGTHSEYDRLLN